MASHEKVKDLLAERKLGGQKLGLITEKNAFDFQKSKSGFASLVRNNVITLSK